MQNCENITESTSHLQYQSSEEQDSLEKSKNVEDESDG